MRRLIPPALLLVAALAAAQLRESMTVEVIEVPVYVAFADGTPVRGLERGAFTLLVNGKPHPIEYFDAIDYAESSAPSRRAQGDVAAMPEERRDLRQRRLYLLLFDLAYTRPGYIARAQRAADIAVGRSDPAVDSFAVATYTHTAGVKLVTPFSNDHVVVRRAIETLTPGDARDALGIGIASERRAKWMRIEASATGKPISETFEFESSDPEAAEKVKGGVVNQEISRQPMKDDVNREMARIGNAASLLAGLEGQKHVIIFSAGFDFSLIPDKGQGYGEDPQIRRYIDDMAQSFRRAGAFLDAINVAGQPGDDATLVRMSEPTGGQVIRNPNDLGDALNRLTSSQQVVYLLGFRRGDLKSGNIAVRVDGIPRSARVSYRTGFGKQQSPDMSSLQLADILINDVPQNGLSLHVDVEKDAIVMLYKPPEVAAQLDPAKPWLDVLLYVFDEHGGIALTDSKRIPFDAKSSATVAGIREAMKLAPGRYLAKALLHVVGTQSAGYAKVAFEAK